MSVIIWSIVYAESVESESLYTDSKQIEILIPETCILGFFIWSSIGGRFHF